MGGTPTAPAPAAADHGPSAGREQAPSLVAGAVADAPRRFPSFDGLRAIAAVSIVALHASVASGFTGRSSFGPYSARLEIGVAVFFLISGFLLYRPFAASHIAGSASPRTGSFWLRRFLRIVPAYWLAYLFTIYVLQVGPHLPNFRTLLVDLGFLQIYSPTYILTGVGQAWSLCTAVTFYLFLPIFAAVVARGRRRPGPSRLRRELVGVATLFVVGIAFRFWVLQSSSGDHAVMTTWLPACLDLFALGMFLAVVSSWLAHRRSTPRWLWHRAMPWASWGMAVLVFWAVSNIGLSTQPLDRPSPLRSIEEELLYGLFAFFLLLPAVFGPERSGLVRRALQWKPVAAIGVVSYGIYLWHQAWIALFLRWGARLVHHPLLFKVPLPVMFGVVLGAAVASAALSYFLVERPVLELKNRFGWWQSVGSTLERSRPHHGAEPTRPARRPPEPGLLDQVGVPAAVEAAEA